MNHPCYHSTENHNPWDSTQIHGEFRLISQCEGFMLNPRMFGGLEMSMLKWIFVIFRTLIIAISSFEIGIQGNKTRYR